MASFNSGRIAADESFVFETISSQRPAADASEQFLFLDRVIFVFRQGPDLPAAIEIIQLEERTLMRPDLAQRTLTVFLRRLVAVAHPVLAALGLQVDGDFG